LPCVSAFCTWVGDSDDVGPAQKAIERNPDPEEDAQGRFHFPLLAPTLHWLDAVPLRFLRLLLPQSTSLTRGAGRSTARTQCVRDSLIGGETWADAGEGLIIQWRSRLRWLVYETLGALRTTQLFDIIIDYPDSTPAVEDLRLCLENTNHHAQVRQGTLVRAILSAFLERFPQCASRRLAVAPDKSRNSTLQVVSTFRIAVQKRLLLEGATTEDILSSFVSTIRVLRELDPAGVTLEDS
jgi:anaphase-promoting complex subunit 2